MGKSLIDKLRKGVRNTILLGAALASIGFASCKFPGPNPVPPTPPLIDFTSVENTYLNPDSTSSYGLNEGQPSYSVPLPTQDKNGNPVTYTGAQGDSNVTASVSGFNLVLSESNPISADTNYSVKVSYNDNGTSSSTTLTGKLFDLPDIQGQLQSNEDHQPYAGILEILYTDGNGTHFVDATNSKMNVGSIDSSKDASGNSIIDTDSVGNFNVRINQRTDNLTAMVLKAGIGSYTTNGSLPTGAPFQSGSSGFSSPYYGPNGSFTRVLTTDQPPLYGGPSIQTLTLGDNNINIHAVPLTTLLNSGSNQTVTTSQAFQTFFLSFDNVLGKYNIPNVEIAYSYLNPSDSQYSYFSSPQQTIANSLVSTLNNIITVGTNNNMLRQGLNFPLQIDLSGTPTEIGASGWEVLIPADSSTVIWPVMGQTNYNGNNAQSYINVSYSGFNAIVIHELSHGLIETADTSGYQYDSAFDIYSINTPITLPTNIDKKSTLIIFEETYRAAEDVKNYILKVGF